MPTRAETERWKLIQTSIAVSATDATLPLSDDKSIQNAREQQRRLVAQCHSLVRHNRPTTLAGEVDDHPPETSNTVSEQLVAQDALARTQLARLQSQLAQTEQQLQEARQQLAAADGQVTQLHRRLNRQLSCVTNMAFQTG